MFGVDVVWLNGFLLILYFAHTTFKGDGNSLCQLTDAFHI